MFLAAHAHSAAWCMMQEISKIVGDMWQKALPDQKAPYIEQVSSCNQPQLHSISQIALRAAHTQSPLTEWSAQSQCFRSWRLHEAMSVPLITPGGTAPKAGLLAHRHV